MLSCGTDLFFLAWTGLTCFQTLCWFKGMWEHISKKENIYKYTLFSPSLPPSLPFLHFPIPIHIFINAVSMSSGHCLCSTAPLLHRGNGSYLVNQDMWTTCVHPKNIVLWNIVLFSILLAMGLLQIVLCGLQAINGCLGCICGDCRDSKDVSERNLNLCLSWARVEEFLRITWVYLWVSEVRRSRQ